MQDYIEQRETIRNQSARAKDGLSPFHKAYLAARDVYDRAKDALAQRDSMTVGELKRARLVYSEAISALAKAKLANKEAKARAQAIWAQNRAISENGGKPLDEAPIMWELMPNHVQPIPLPEIPARQS